MQNELQRNEDWRMARCGKITASSIFKLLMSPTTETYKNYITELALEQVTNIPTESYTNSAMQWGVDNEGLARLAYEMYSGDEVQEVGFIQHETLMVGASPDGLVKLDGLIEIKCPNTTTHLETLFNGTIDKKYHAQMQCQMWITGRNWCDFVSYDPRLIGKAQMHVIRVNRDEKFITGLQEACIQAIKEIDEIVNKIRKINE